MFSFGCINSDRFLWLLWLMMNIMIIEQSNKHYNER